MIQSSYDQADLTKWFQEVVTEYNELIKKCNPRTHYLPSIYGDFGFPCRIFAICTVQPMVQLVIVHKDAGVKGSSIQVHGPVRGNEFVHTAHELLKTNWLSQKLNRISSSSFMYYRDYADHDLLFMTRFVNAKVEGQKKNPRPEYVDGPLINPHFQDYSNSYFSWLSVGNLLRKDPIQFAKTTFDSRRQSERSSSKGETLSHTAVSLDATTPTQRGFISAFYPPLWLGEFPTPSYHQRIVTGSYVPPYSKQISCQYKGCNITIYRDGFFVIAIDDKNACLRYLNEIMGMFLVSGVGVESISSADLGEATLYENGNVGGYQLPAMKSAERSRLVDLDSSTMTENELKVFKRRECPEEKFPEIMERASKVAPEKSHFLMWLVRSFTFLCKSEFTYAGD